MSSRSEPQWLLVLTIMAVAYAVIALPLSHRGRWLKRRMVLWYAGLLLACLGLVGPLAQRSHDDFPAHVVTHLLLGMAAPLCIALSAPVSLILRALPVGDARRLVHILATRPLRIATHVVTTAILSVGGMWVLYLTPLYGLMHDHRWVEIVVQLHTAVAGYLFASAAIGLDPAPHRPSRMFRAAVLVVAFGGHAALARLIYGHPLIGVPVGQAEAGSQVMSYGGDLLEVALIAIFCWQWYRATRPRSVPAADASHKMVRAEVSS